MNFDDNRKRSSLSCIALFTSLSTLICCALPIVLVSLGLGTTYAAMTDKAPWLVTLGEYKLVTFIIAGILIAIASWMSFRPGRSCPTNPILASHCKTVDTWNKRLLIIAAIAWFIGFFAAYLALPLQVWLDNFGS